MRSTQQFSVTLPNEMAASIRAKVASGEYASESEVMPEGIRALNARERAVDDWLRQQALPAYDAYLADPSRGIALEDVRALIASEAAGNDRTIDGLSSHRLHTQSARSARQP